MKCPKCHYKSNNKNYISSHLKLHNEKNIFKCPYENCYFLSKFKYNFDRHIKLTHETKNMTLICHICKTNYYDIISFTDHINLYHNNEKKIYKCSYKNCYYLTNKENNLKQHKSKHHKNKKFKCKDCDYIAKDITLLNKHIIRVHIKEIKYFCEYCDFKTHDKYNLQIHYHRKHLPHQYLCLICEKTFARNIDLKYHIKNKHKELDGYDKIKLNF